MHLMKRERKRERKRQRMGNAGILKQLSAKFFDLLTCNFLYYGLLITL